MAVCDIRDAAWAEIAPLLPPERGRQARPAQDNRRYLNGMLFVLRTGCPWRRMPARYGKWNSVYVRLQRWRGQGVWDAVEVALARLVPAGALDEGQSQLYVHQPTYLKSEIVPSRRASIRRATVDEGIAT